MSLFVKKTYINQSSTKQILQIVERYNVAKQFNSKAFAEFKGIYTGKNIVIVAAGPSVNQFIPIPDAIYIGMNRACLLDSIKFDYLFSIDLLGINSFMQEFKNYEGKNCIKFIGEQHEGKGRDIPESYFLSLSHARKYKTDILLNNDNIPVDIDCLPLWNGNSVAHQAMQFALFCNPKKIFLVGCDCSGIKSGHFITGKRDNEMYQNFSQEFWTDSQEALIAGWKKLNRYSTSYYNKK